MPSFRLIALLCSAPLVLVPAPAAPGPEGEPVAGGLATLWTHDDRAAAFGFTAGSADGAGRIVGGEIDLADAQLVYGAFEPELLSFGFRHDQLIDVLDLGDLYIAPRERAADESLQYPISVFHTLFLERSRFGYLDIDGRTVRLRAADSLLGVLPDTGLRHLEPLVGHVYLVRWRPRTGRGPDRIAKLQVVAVHPGESLTFRWALVAEL